MKRNTHKTVSLPAKAWKIIDLMAAEKELDRSKVLFQAILQMATASKNKEIQELALQLR